LKISILSFRSWQIIAPFALRFLEDFAARANSPVVCIYWPPALTHIIASRRQERKGEFLISNFEFFNLLLGGLPG
jgi:hypothetical protein